MCTASSERNLESLSVCGNMCRYSSLSKFPEPGMKNEFKKRLGCGGRGSDTGVRQIQKLLVPSICGEQNAIPSRADAGLKMQSLKPSNAPVRDADSRPKRSYGHSEGSQKGVSNDWQGDRAVDAPIRFAQARENLTMNEQQVEECKPVAGTMMEIEFQSARGDCTYLCRIKLFDCAAKEGPDWSKKEREKRGTNAQGDKLGDDNQNSAYRLTLNQEQGLTSIRLLEIAAGLRSIQDQKQTEMQSYRMDITVKRRTHRYKPAMAFDILRWVSVKGWLAEDIEANTRIRGQRCCQRLKRSERETGVLIE
ncbi:hypothetical protein B0H19DRAFT_1065305 [Mycena capillaripes]|nr:hypothetical protein B0H19DRAFT_1065305 [Mycena capillaripes]